MVYSSNKKSESFCILFSFCGIRQPGFCSWPYINEVSSAIYLPYYGCYVKQMGFVRLFSLIYHNHLLPFGRNLLADLRYLR